MGALTEEKGLALLDKREAGLKALREEYLNLTINGIEDREGYKKVSEARKILKERQALMAPDKEKLAAFAKEVAAIAHMSPAVKSHEAYKVMNDAKQSLLDISNNLLTQSESL